MLDSLDQWEAPQGFERLRAGRIYFRLRTDSARGRLIFVTFEEMPSAHLEIVSQAKFEGAVGSQIAPASKPLTLPPWLSDFGSIGKLSNLIIADEAAIEAATVKRAMDEAQAGQLSLKPADMVAPGPMSVSQIVAFRVDQIHEAVTNIKDVLAEDDPDLALNRYARKCTPPQNETRFRIWFYVYICWGRNRAVLLPSYHLRGHYDRLDDKYANSIFGRASNDGTKCPTRPTPALVAAIQQAFVNRAKLGLTRAKVYADAMRKDFDCRTRLEHGKHVFFHPRGAAFPTEDQFWHQCEKKWGSVHIKKVLRGDETHRNKEATSIGSYSMSLTNVCEQVFADACFSDEYARSYVDDEPMAKIAVAEFYDGVTGMGLGIGGSLDVESGWSYLEGLFCMAVPKSFFGMLIGYSITDEEWPGYGVPSMIRVDRGPGASKKVLEQLKRLAIWRAMTPSYSPQSNATAESRHGMEPTIHGAPAFKVSKHTPIQMFRLYVERMLRKNRSSSALARVGVDQLIRGEVTPLEMYRDMLSRARSDAQPIPIDTAICTLLPPLAFDVREDSLRLGPVRYTSDEFMKTKTGLRLRKLNGSTLSGHSLSLTAKYAWVEVDGVPIMVQATTPFRDDDRQLNLSPAELAQLARMNSQADTQLRRRQSVEIAASEERYEAKTGMPADVVSRRKGRKGLSSAQVRAELQLLKRP
jgi:hypothetical protein